MGLRDMFNSVTEKVRNACRSSYDVGLAAVSKKFKDYIPDAEAQEKIVVHTQNLVDSPLCKEVRKLIPGAGLACEMYKWWKSVQNDNKTKGKQAGNHKEEADRADLKNEEEMLHVQHPAPVTAEKPVLKSKL